MTLKSKPLAALILAILFGGIFFSSAMGWWQTESSKEAAVYTTGEFAGQANPEDIRGSYTFGDIEKNFGIPAAILAQAFSVPTGDPAGFQVKSLEEMYAASSEEVGTTSVRLFVAFYKSLPFDLSTDIFLPEPAAILLRERSLTGERAAYLAAHKLSNPEVDSGPEGAGAPRPAQTPAVSPNPQVENSPADSGERLVKGKTTFGELLEWSVPKEAIEQVFGAPLPDSTGMTVKDFCTEAGLSFETIKPVLQAEVDRVK